MRSFLVAAILACTICALAQQNGSSAREELYASATIDSQGQLLIRTTDGREIAPRKERVTFDSDGWIVLTPPLSEPVRDSDQVGFSSATISPDKRTVGWLALFPNCCTSYPIPRYLALYANGKSMSLQGSGLPVWKWCFLEGGKQVGFEQETVHGGWGVHYELREVRTGKTIARYDPHTDNNEQVDDDPAERPDWVKAVDAAK